MIACSKSNQAPGGSTIPPPGTGNQKTFNVSLKAEQSHCCESGVVEYGLPPNSNPFAPNYPCGPEIIISAVITNLSPGISIAKYSWKHTDSTFNNVLDTSFVKCPYQVLTSNSNTTLTSDSLVYSLQTLQPGTTYYFRVVVTDNMGNSQISNTSTITN